LQQKGKVNESKKEEQNYDDEIPVVVQQSQCRTIVRTLL